MAKEWRNMTPDERVMTVYLCFIASYAKIAAMERGDIMPQFDELARLKTWWNTIPEEQKRSILDYVHKLPAELDLYQNSISGGETSGSRIIITGN